MAKTIKKEKIIKKKKTEKQVIKKQTIKKKETKKPVEKLLYSLLGDLVINTATPPPIVGGSKQFVSDAMVVDSFGCVFVPTTLNVSINNYKKVVMLTAEEVELLLKLLRVAKYDSERKNI